MAILTRLTVPGTPEAWATLGFHVTDGTFSVGRVVFETGTTAWAFDALEGDATRLGVPTTVADPPDDVVDHPNLIDRIDHVVYAVPNLNDAVDALTDSLAMPPKRRAFPRGPAGPEMAFFTVGDGFIEVVESGRPPALWGIAFQTPDLDACVTAVRQAGGPIGDPKPAVQGGRIASVWKEHVGWGVAVMEPAQRRSEA